MGTSPCGRRDDTRLKILPLRSRAVKTPLLFSVLNVIILYQIRWNLRFNYELDEISVEKTIDFVE